MFDVKTVYAERLHGFLRLAEGIAALLTLIERLLSFLITLEYFVTISKSKITRENFANKQRMPEDLFMSGYIGLPVKRNLTICVINITCKFIVHCQTLIKYKLKLLN